MLSKIGKSRGLFLVQAEVFLLVHQFRVLLRSSEKHRASPAGNEKGMRFAPT